MVAITPSHTSPILHITSIKWTLTYLALIPLVNLAFVYVPTISIPGGGEWTPLTIFVGLILVFRDFAQREIGHYIGIPLIIGVTISYQMAGPEIALASGLAFLISETIDWTIYSLANKPLSERILLSSIVSAPVDTLVFLWGADQIVAGMLTPVTALMMIVSKLAGACVVSMMIEKRTATSATNANRHI